MTNDTYLYSDIDYNCVRHYILYGSKAEAYKFGRTGTLKSNNKQSIQNMSWKYFKQDHIVTLLKIECEKLKDNFAGIAERIGMKNPMQENKGQNDKQNDPLPDYTDNLDKEQAKKVLVRLINTNKTDAKTVSQAMQLLSKLEQWEKEKPTSNSNITIYELPKKC